MFFTLNMMESCWKKTWVLKQDNLFKSDSPLCQQYCGDEELFYNSAFTGTTLAPITAAKKIAKKKMLRPVNERRRNAGRMILQVVVDFENPERYGLEILAVCS
jgi:hypothetical protein